MDPVAQLAYNDTQVVRFEIYFAVLVIIQIISRVTYCMFNLTNMWNEAVNKTNVNIYKQQFL